MSSRFGMNEIPMPTTTSASGSDQPIRRARPATPAATITSRTTLSTVSRAASTRPSFPTGGTRRAGSFRADLARRRRGDDDRLVVAAEGRLGVDRLPAEGEVLAHLGRPPVAVDV